MADSLHEVSTKYSIVIPMKDEEENVGPLYSELKEVLDILPNTEVIFVDDGSRDKTFIKLKEVAVDHRIKIIRLARNVGQSGALAIGFKHAEGEVVVTIDGDLQEDPKDIPKLVDKLKEGFDAVVGIREGRKDKHLRKIIPSRVFRWLLNRFFKVNISDVGTVGAFRKETLQGVDLRGELHRFFPVLLLLKGFSVGEVGISHRQRKFGKSKVGVSRLLRGSLDLISLYLVEKYFARPVHLFGMVGFATGGIGFLISFYLAIDRLVFGNPIGDRPLLLLAVVLIISGLQFMSSGLIMEMIIKTRVGREEQTYNRLEKVNFRN